MRKQSLDLREDKSVLDQSDGLRDSNEASGEPLLNGPEKLPPELDPAKFQSLPELIGYSLKTHADMAGFSCFGKTLSYGEIDRLSANFAAYLQQKTPLKPGDRIAIQLPNVLQFPIALYGALRAGLVVVSTNPLYTEQELEHQFNDSGAVAVVTLDAFAAKIQSVLPRTQLQTVIVARLGDLQAPLKGLALNLAAKYLKKMVPSWSLPQAVTFGAAVEPQAIPYVPPTLGREQVAVLLYTGGTTGVAKGAMLSHGNLLANVMQFRSRSVLVMDDRSENVAAPLPLYHSYAFLMHCFAMPYAGNHNVLVTNPRDIPGLVSTLEKYRINGFVGINTLYLALLRHPSFARLERGVLKFCGAGGMAMSSSVAEEWESVTGCEVIEGYGLTECSPAVTVNIPGRVKQGTVGLAVPETELCTADEAGNILPAGERGELWIRGPQVMLGYWGQEQATREAINAEGWFKSGDYAEIDVEGFVRIVDRKKDMILVSGFNVFPNEIEDWVDRHAKVLESAAIGVANEKTGETVKLFVVKNDASLTEEELLAHCREGLTAYKMPKQIVFADDLPKSIIGKILRRELR